MKKICIAIFLLFASLSSLLAIPSGEISSESLALLLSDNGCTAYVDEEGDVTVEDQYGMEYWIMHFPSERRIWIQSGWAAADGVRNADASRLVNECNNLLLLIRCFYSSMYRTFYCDYDLYYGEDGLDDALFVSIMQTFFEQADIYTDYLIGEDAI